MSLQTNVNYNTTPTHLYYDINIINNDKSGKAASAPVVFNDTRSDVIIKNPSEYFLSVNRFSLDTTTLPLFVPIIEVIGGTVTPPIYNTIYSIGFGSGALSTIPDVTIPIQFLPQDLTVPQPLLQSVKQNNIQEYFYLYSYQAFIDLINQSMINGMVANGLTSTTIPFWSFDKETNKASILFPQPSDNSIRWGGDYSTSGSTATPRFLYLNTPLYNLFCSFQAEYVETLRTQILPTVILDDSGWYRLTINPANQLTGIVTPLSRYNTNIIGNNTIIATDFPFRNANYYPAFTGEFTVLTQDYPTTPLWTPIQSVVFTTALLPVVNELTGRPVVFNDEQSGFNAGGNNRNILPVLTDIEVPLKRGDEYKPTLFYSPDAEYRLIDLSSNTPINSIQISIFWKDNYGLLHPLLLDTGCTASLKLMFRKKIFNLSSI